MTEFLWKDAGRQFRMKDLENNHRRCTRDIFPKEHRVHKSRSFGLSPLLGGDPRSVKLSQNVLTPR
jgi:hypothetical protein